MKLKTCLLLFVIFFANNLFAQKLYVWCPKDQMINARQNFLDKDTIDLVMFDGRTLTKDSRLECTSENTILVTEQVIKNTYPAAIFNVLKSSDYYKDPSPNRITIKIAIAAFHAAFGADVKIGIGNVGGSFAFGIFPEGKWNAVTAYAIKIYDYRGGKEIKVTKDVAKTGSKPNMFGYSTAKNILNDTYIQANQEMFFFIDQTFMK